MVSDDQEVDMEAERNKEHLLAVTESLCPVCLQRIAAERVERNGRVFLKKTCPQHGSYEVCIWQGTPAYSAWTKGATDAAPDSCRAQHDRFRTVEFRSDERYRFRGRIAHHLLSVPLVNRFEQHDPFFKA